MDRLRRNNEIGRAAKEEGKVEVGGGVRRGWGGGKGTRKELEREYTFWYIRAGNEAKFYPVSSGFARVPSPVTG